MQRRRWERMHALYEQALKQDGFRSDTRIENQEIKSLIATLVPKCFGKLLEFYGIQRKEHKDAHRNKSHDLYGSSADRDGNLQRVSSNMFDHGRDLRGRSEETW